MWSGITPTGFSQEKVPSQGGEISPVTKIALEVMALLQKTSTPLEEITKKILLDPALTLVVIKGAYGEKREGNAHLTLTEAMEKLGFSALKTLLSEFFTRSLYTRNRALQMLLWKHSLTVALATEKIAGAIGLEREESYLCGLLHDVGKLVLAANFPQGYQEVIAACQQGQGTILDMERRFFGASHAEVGAYLLGLWGVEDAVVRAVYLHHEPGRGQQAGFSPLAAVHVANRLEHELVVINEGYAVNPLDDLFLAASGLSARLPVWREACAAVPLGLESEDV